MRSDPASSGGFSSVCAGRGVRFSGWISPAWLKPWGPLAKAAGAEVTAVVATRHLDLVKSLGADRAVDYTAEDFTRIGESFDFVFEAVGKIGFFRCRRLLKPGGTFMATDIGRWGEYFPLILWSSIAKNNRVVVPPSSPRQRSAFVEFLKARIVAGQFRAVIDRKYPLEAIADAYRYVETGKKVGIVVIEVRPD